MVIRPPVIKVVISACAKCLALREQNYNEMKSFTICVSCLVVLSIIEGLILLLSLRGLSTLWRLAES